MVRTFANEDINLRVEDGVAFVEVQIEDITLKDAKKMVETRYEITDGAIYPVIIDISNIKSVSKEARVYLSQGRAIERISAAALYTNSLVARIVANFFLGFNRPNIPIKIFTNRNEALKWAKNYRTV